jgi:hypothetical protein
MVQDHEWKFNVGEDAVEKNLDSQLAKYPQHCSACPSMINKGDPFRRGKDGKWRHDRCPKDAPDVEISALSADLQDAYDAGYAAAETNMELRWHEVWLATQAALKQPTQAQLAARRGVPNDPCPYGQDLLAGGCGCSRCIRALQVQKNLAKWGTENYPSRARRKFIRNMRRKKKGASGAAAKEDSQRGVRV